MKNEKKRGIMYYITLTFRMKSLYTVLFENIIQEKVF